MRIILTTSKPFRSGSSLRMLNLARGGVIAGHDVHLAVPDEPDWHDRLQLEPQFEVLFYDLALQARSAIVNRLRDSCLEHHKVVVHAQKTSDLLLCLQALEDSCKHIALVAHRSVAFPLKQEEVRIYRNIRIDRIMAVSNATARQVARQLGSDCPPITVIYPGVNINAFASTVYQAAVPNAVPVIGMLANHYRIKRVDIALQALRLLLQERSVRFLFVGSPEGKNMKSYAKQLGIAEWCEFVGWQNDVRPWLARMDIVVLCSDTEGAPGALLEAMAMGIPVVATRVGGVPEIVTDGVTGLLVEPNNADKLADRIAAILDSPSLAQRLRIKGRQQVVTRFSEALRRQKVLQLYADLVETRTRKRMDTGN